MVTGATGYVGSHIAAALLKSGHDVRLLVRQPEQVAKTFESHGVMPTDVVVGDIRDVESVRLALEGCDACVHAAAIFSLNPNHVRVMKETNLAAARLVLGEAVAAGCDPVVHISSTVALTRRGGSGPDLPLGDVDLAYARSKVESEKVARDLQSQGAPVVCVYPGGVFGPYDPYLGDQATRLCFIVRGLFIAWPQGGMHCVDARDVGAVVVAALKPGQGPRRYVVPGMHVRAEEMYGAVSRAIGKRRRYVTMPGPLAASVTRVMGTLQRALPDRWHYPADHEGAVITLRDTVMDDQAARTERCVTPIPWDQSVRDTIGWLVDAGHLPAKYRPVEPVSDTNPTRRA
jgi:nucleoside-diphosphate-sugar epimerase